MDKKLSVELPPFTGEKCADYGNCKSNRKRC